MNKTSFAHRLALSCVVIAGSLAVQGQTAHADETGVDELAQVTQARAAVIAQVRALGTLMGVSEEDLTNAVKRLGESARLVRQEAAAREDAGRAAAPAARLPVMPVPSGTVSSPFGPRGAEVHEGIDFAASMYAPVVAAASGVVVAAGHPYRAQGDDAAVVIIAHDLELSTLYGHLDDKVKRWTVKVGDRVHAGQVIGYVGTSGRTSGPHLHFMALLHGKPVDPAPLFPR
jgi:murein DD-endopeptidase MepM/ murein hydrolase activator NlpD